QFLKQDKYRYILNGLLIGACIGAGFAVFETAGYAFNFLLAYGTGKMLDVLILRGILAIGGHVVWSSMVGGGIVIDKTKSGAMIQFMLMAIVLHAIWDMPITIGSDIYLVQIILTIAAWIIILTLIASGLKQVKRISNYYKKQKEIEKSNI
ncbi:MAG: PrsW family glutamic-type intramembrane protease, partial [Faecalibacillus sp.]